MKLFVISFLCVLYLTLAFVLEQANSDESVEMMILGTYHFDNPGLDAVNPDVPDVLEDEPQNQISAVVDQLAEFSPDKITIERPPDRSSFYDSLMQAYKNGKHELERPEDQQIGMRLAGKLDHSTVYPVDHHMDVPFQQLMEYAAENEPETAARFQRWQEENQQEDNRKQQEMSINELLKEKNTTTYLNKIEEPYHWMKQIGVGDSYIGAETVSKWYDRNFRIFTNIRDVTGPGDRVLVIIGAGHARILRELAQTDSDINFVDPLNYLE